MNAGFATAAPQPPPPGPQGSVAPSGASASTKPAGEAFGAHLAKAIAVKTPVKTVDDNRPADQTSDRPPERIAQTEKADRPTSKGALKEAAVARDEDQTPSANLSGSDAAAQAQAAGAVTALSPLPKADAPAKTVEALEAGSPANSKAQTLLPVTLAAADAVDTKANEALADLKLAPAVLEAGTPDLAASLIDGAAPQAQPPQAQAASTPAPKADLGQQAEAAKLASAQTQAAQAQVAQAQLAQAQTAQGQETQADLPQVASQPSASPDDRSATGAKASLGANKAGVTTSDGKAAKSDPSTAFTPTGPEGVVTATSWKSGGESAGGDDPRHEFDASSAPGRSVDSAPPQSAPADVAQQPLQAPVHIAPQTLQTAAVAMKSGPQTVTGLAAQIVSKFDGATTRFDVELHPLDLGRVDVRLEVSAGGQISAAMSFDNPQAAAEMRARSADLQRALENAGFNLSGGLSFDVAGDRGQGGSQNSGAEPGLAQRARALETAASAATEAADTAMTHLMSAYGAKPSRGVDIRI